MTRPKGSRASAKTVLAISDTHSPFQHIDTLRFLKEVAKEYRPDRVVHIGDLLDQHTLTRFVRESSGKSVSDELYTAREFVKKLGAVFPAMDVCMGNHDVRFHKRANEAGIPGDFLRDYGDIVGAPRAWRFDREFQIGNVRYVHGDGYTGQSAGLNVLKHTFQNTVFGHTHAAAVTYLNGIWSLNVGCLIDVKQYAFAYARHFKVQPTIGCGIVRNGVPHFIPR